MTGIIGMEKFGTRARNPHKASRVNEGPSADDRFTPRYLIRALHAEFKFTIDVAGNQLSPAANVIGRWLQLPKLDGLATSWGGERVFCNPPFSQIERWVRKATFETDAGGCGLVVMLLPWNRQEQPWWQQYIEMGRDWRLPNLHTRITTIALGGGQYGVKGRVKYGTPDDPEGKRPHNSPNFGSGLVIWHRA